MMMMPSIFGENLFDDFMDGLAKPLMQFENYIDQATAMKTDVKEFDDRYEFNVELPGIAKEDVKAEFSEGYLTITATREEKNEQESDGGKYICRERSIGTSSRRFYIGKEIKKDDIKASFVNGILQLNVPKVPKEEIENNKLITIEG